MKQREISLSLAVDRIALGIYLAIGIVLLSSCSDSKGNTGAGDGGGGNKLVTAPSCPVLQNPKSTVQLAAVRDETPSKRFIVKISSDSEAFMASTSLQERFSSDLKYQAKVKKIHPSFYHFEFSSPVSASDLAKRLHANDFEYIEPDYEVKQSFIPNDPQLNGQWAHAVVDSKDAWDISRGSKDVIVGVLDSGIDYTHPDLADNIWTNPNEKLNGLDNDGNGLIGDIHGWNFVDNNNRPIADDTPTYHGTHVAGTIGAIGNNGIGISGHAPLVTLMPLKFIASSGSGFVSDAIKGIDYAISKGAKIISNSWGSPQNSQALSAAIDRAQKAGVLFVVAAGNMGSNNDVVPFYPSSYPQDNVIRVAASDSTDKLASWSDFGMSVDIAAPGVNILSTKNGNAYQYMSGTSMATPLVSGVLATMEALRPDLGYKQIKSALLSNVDLIPGMKGKIASGGRIDSFKALSAINHKLGGLLPNPVAPGGNCP